jgi:hypothetical protein
MSTPTNEREQELVAQCKEGASLKGLRDLFKDIAPGRVMGLVGGAGFGWENDKLSAIATESEETETRSRQRIAPLENVAPVSIEKESWWQGIGIYSDYKFSNFGRVSRMTGRRGAGADQPIRVQPSAKPIRRGGKIVSVEWVMMANLTLPGGKAVKRNIARILADAMRGVQIRNVAPWFDAD